jgi:UDP-N-acetylmuramate dehydrogenase
MLSHMAEIGELTYGENIPLALHSSFKIGGPADFVIFPTSEQALISLVSFMKKNEIRFSVFGNGTNLLFSDNGFRGACLFTTRLKKISYHDQHIQAQSGVSLNLLARMAQKKGLSGLEFAYGIPGTVGGAVFMNAGAFGGEISQVLCSSHAITLDGSIITLSAQEHQFSYRNSSYEKSGNILLEADFYLIPGDPATIEATMNQYMARRIEKQPLEFPSAGSVFKRYPGKFTGKLIEEAGLKGCMVGGAQVSEKHAGFIVNCGHATAKDVLTLIEKIQSVIWQREGISIESEIRIISEK